jgi:hypothetical protein
MSEEDSEEENYVIYVPRIPIVTDNNDLDDVEEYIGVKKFTSAYDSDDSYDPVNKPYPIVMYNSDEYEEPDRDTDDEDDGSYSLWYKSGHYCYRGNFLICKKSTEKRAPT